MGLGCGLTIPHMVNDSTYFAISSCFYAPHLKFWKEKSERHRDKAIPVESLDAYLLDVGKSFLFFLLIIGPTLYSTYYLGEDIIGKAGLAEKAANSGT